MQYITQVYFLSKEVKKKKTADNKTSLSWVIKIKIWEQTE